MVEAPESHGSTSTEKVPGGCAYELDRGRCSMGEKVKRKVVSPLRCLTLRDMTYLATAVGFWKTSRCASAMRADYRMSMVEEPSKVAMLILKVGYGKMEGVG